MRRQAEPNILASKKAKYARHGWHRGEHEDRQIYRCPTCGRRFRNSPGFECRQVLRLYTTPAMMVLGIARGINKKHSLIFRMAYFTTIPSSPTAA